MDVVIPYIHGPHNGEELRYALRSIAANLVSRDGIRLVLIGDRPDWIRNVEHVPLPPLSGAQVRSRDALRKLLLAAELCPEGFVHMYDDTYFITPTQIGEIRERIHTCDLAGVDIPSRYAETSTEWQMLMRRTVKLLKERNLPMLNHETHTPRWFEPISVRYVMEEYDLLNKPAHFRTLYFNTVRPEVPSRLITGPTDPFKLSAVHRATIEWLQLQAPGSRVMNHRNMDYTSNVQAFLKQRFARPSRYEC